MKSRIKITQQKDNAGTLVNYFNHKDATSYRYALLNEIINNQSGNIVLIIDTNRKIKDINLEEIETTLEKNGIGFLKSPIKSTKRRMMGLQFLNFRKKKEDKPAYVFFFEIGEEKFTEEFFNSFLYLFDISIGFDCQKELSEIQSLYLADYNHVLFNEETFFKTVYDSVIFSQLRASFDIENQAISME